MKRTIAGIVAAALLACISGAAADDRLEYNRRNAERYATLFNALDRDGDGAVTRVEAQGDLNFVPYFNDMDIDRDATVTGAELQRFVQQQFGVQLQAAAAR